MCKKNFFIVKSLICEKSCFVDLVKQLLYFAVARVLRPFVQKLNV